jgi:hypothetical protein
MTSVTKAPQESMTAKEVPSLAEFDFPADTISSYRSSVLARTIAADPETPTVEPDVAPETTPTTTPVESPDEAPDEIPGLVPMPDADPVPDQCPIRH